MKKFLSILLTSAMLANISLIAFADEAETEEVPVEQFNITVQTDERQTYEGFGFSLVSDFIYKMPQDHKEQTYKLLYDDLNTNAVRLWFNNKEYFKGEGDYDLTHFINYHKYGQGSLLDGAISRKIEHFILAPSGGFPSFLVGEDVNPATGETMTYKHLKPSMADEYAKGLANAIYDLRTEHEIPITGTGIYNEPADFRADVMAMVIPKLRQYLDELGCKDVFIIAPEKANNDANSYKYLETLINDPEALKSIDALSTHSYNMGLTKQTADITIKSGIKRFWQTESSTTGTETEEDFGNGITTAARFINDMNHMVTEWFNFQGVHTNPENGVAMCGYKNNTFYPHQKYYYLKQLTNTFYKDAVFYHSTSDKEGEMEFTYGTKNKVYSCTAQNADGTWAIAVCNATDTTQHEWYQTRSKFYKENALQKDTIAEVTLNVLGLSQSGKQEFKVVRTSRQGDLLAEDNITAENGVIKLTLNPCDLVTLTSVKPIEKAEVKVEVEYYEEQELILPDKPDDMTDYQYELWIQGSKVLGYDESKLPEWTPEYRTVIKERVVNTASVDKHVVTLLIGSPFSFVAGEKKFFDETNELITPIVHNGSTYVPIRFIEMIGGKTTMKADAKTVIAQLNNYVVQLSVGDRAFYVNGRKCDFGAAPEVINGRIYIPVRGFVENIGKTLTWDSRGLIMITDDAEINDIVYSLLQKYMPEEEETEEESTQGEAE